MKSKTKYYTVVIKPIVLRLLALGTSVLVSTGFTALHKLFAAQPRQLSPATLVLDVSFFDTTSASTGWGGGEKQPW